MKIDGVLIQLDPGKKYIWIVDPDEVNIEDLINSGNVDGGVIRAHNMDGFKIVEFTDNIVGFVTRFEDASLEKVLEVAKREGLPVPK